MVDYDVMVFVRLSPSFVFFNDVDQIFREGDKAILIVSYSWYKSMRNHIIKVGSDIVSEIQLIHPRHA